MIGEFKGAYRWLSNFWPAKVYLQDIEFPTVEHAYQAAKNPDKQYQRRVASLKTPGDAKRAGQKVELRDDWATRKFEVMEDLLRQKFTIPELRANLLATGDQELVEGNYWGDRIWGVCRGEGENCLGKLLMKIRAEL